MCHAPENTLAAFEKAIEFGTYRIECDVRRTRDGHLVLLHDATLERTTNGVGRVGDHTLDELRTLRAGGTEPIPTLAEALACARGRTKLLIELKEGDEDVAPNATRLIADAGMTSDCTVSSFDENNLRRVRQHDPDLATAYFFTEPRPDFAPQAVVDRLGVSLLVVWPRAASPKVIAQAKRAGLHVRCGLRDDLSFEQTRDLFHHLAALGVDEIACGRPDWLQQIISASEAEAERGNGSEAALSGATGGARTDSAGVSSVAL